MAHSDGTSGAGIRRLFQRFTTLSLLPDTPYFFMLSTLKARQCRLDPRQFPYPSQVRNSACWLALLHALSPCSKANSHGVRQSSAECGRLSRCWQMRCVRHASIARGRQRFCASTSCNIALSTLRSATRRFNLLFFSSSSFNHLRNSAPRISVATCDVAYRRGVADAHLPATRFNFRTQFGLLDRERDLLLCKPTLLHRIAPSLQGQSCRNLYFNFVRFFAIGAIANGSQVLPIPAASHLLRHFFNQQSPPDFYRPLSPDTWQHQRGPAREKNSRRCR